MRKYPNAPWKEDKIKCVIILKEQDDKGEKIDRQLIKVFVTKDTEKQLLSNYIEKNIPIKDRFKYNLQVSIKMSIPRRVFEQALRDSDVSTYFTTPTIGTANLIAYDRETRIKKEEWFDPDNIAYALYFRNGLFISAEKR